MYNACTSTMKYFQPLEKISSYLYVQHVCVLDAQHSCAKNKKSWNKFFCTNSIKLQDGKFVMKRTKKSYFFSLYILVGWNIFVNVTMYLKNINMLQIYEIFSMPFHMQFHIIWSVFVKHLNFLIIFMSYMGFFGVLTISML
jgi:hypothetical protein